MRNEEPQPWGSVLSLMRAPLGAVPNKRQGITSLVFTWEVRYMYVMNLDFVRSKCTDCHSFYFDYEPQPVNAAKRPQISSHVSVSATRFPTAVMI